MNTTFVMVKCELGKVYDVAADIADRVDPPPATYSISGEYDLMLVFHLDSEIDVGRFITSEVQTIPGIRDTYSIVGFKAFSG
ncbi:Lrp/AsnC family transcriptional regulator [Kiloniella laminariae]|uniref:Lrp/AsnC family transcriptional regulator n=1 Tax=Kiloniella laminariae TaxID=454162 RepID=A0ABT4LNI2_9PROT|nr:Lrp/AsnC family transcriptional regulator [Kiloniella laminariae]MCZ4282698.1 Lrp/AsnC family transcriptional regulator [Kiloniella laminariae]